MNRVVDWSRATILTVAEFDVALDVLGLGPAPAALELCSPGATDVERARIVRGSLAALRSRGLLHGDRFRPDPAEDLLTVTAADVRRELFVAEPFALRAVVGLRGRCAVLAVRSGEEVAMVRLDTRTASAARVELLGPLVPAPGPAVRVPFHVLLDTLRTCAGDRSRLAAELFRHGVCGTAATQLERMAQVYGMAELGAARGGPDPRRAGSFVLVLATPQGHYLQRRPAPDRLGGAPATGATVYAAPADRSTLVDELDGLADAIPDRSTPAGTRRRWALTPDRAAPAAP